MNAKKTTRQNRQSNNGNAAAADQQKKYSNNYVALTGNVGDDAHYFGENNSAASFRLATNYKTDDNREFTEWHSIVVFGELANIAAEKCKKGAFISIRGRLHTSEVKRENVTFYNTEVIAYKIKFLGRK